jgi:hypothetical protein
MVFEWFIMKFMACLLSLHLGGIIPTEFRRVKSSRIRLH